MPDAQLIPHPVFSPGACFFCGGPEGPVVDTMVDLVGDGRIYVCTRTCLPLWAGLAGLLSAEEASRLGQALESAMGEIDALRGELERERESKVVSVSDMVKLIERQREAHQDAVNQQAWAAMVVPDADVTSEQCSATRADGKPCTARVVPGRDVCLAHSKRALTSADAEDRGVKARTLG